MKEKWWKVGGSGRGWEQEQRGQAASSKQQAQRVNEVV